MRLKHDIRYQTECRCPDSVEIIQLIKGQEWKLKGNLLASPVIGYQETSFKQFKHTFWY